MLIAPVLSGGLTIELEGDVASQSYIKMTKIVMKDFGVEVEISNTKIIIPETKYSSRDSQLDGYPTKRHQRQETGIWSAYMYLGRAL